MIRKTIDFITTQEYECDELESEREMMYVTRGVTVLVLPLESEWEESRDGKRIHNYTIPKKILRGTVCLRAVSGPTHDGKHVTVCGVNGGKVEAHRTVGKNSAFYLPWCHSRIEWNERTIEIWNVTAVPNGGDKITVVDERLWTGTPATFPPEMAMYSKAISAVIKGRPYQLTGDET